MSQTENPTTASQGAPTATDSASVGSSPKDAGSPAFVASPAAPTPASPAAPPSSSVPPPAPPTFHKLANAPLPTAFIPSHATVSDYRLPEEDLTRRNAMYAYGVMVVVLGATLAMFAWTALLGMSADSTQDEASKDDGSAAINVKMELAPSADGKILDSLPQFQLTRADGTPFTRADMDGSLWVVDFIFTDCPAGCPTMTGKMAELDSWLATLETTSPAFANVKLLSITVDPEKDTPSVLTRYAASAKASKRWVFATGNPDVISKIARDGFAATGTEDKARHSLRLYLVDHVGRVRSWYSVVPPMGQATVTDKNDFKQLQTDLWQRLAEHQNTLPDGGM